MRFALLAGVLSLGLAACSGSSGPRSSGAAGGGAAGSIGSTGAAGTTGLAGTTGAVGGGGTTGLAGTTGEAGTTGAAGTSATDGGAADATSTADARVFTGTAKLMVLGSSNELGTCWRAYLWQELHTNGITNFDFVGQQSGGPSCTVTGWDDTELQAMNGNIITNITADTYRSWFMANPPDVILMHFGGADILSDLPVDGVMQSFQRALDAARLVNPKVVLLIAQHTPEGKDAILTLNADIAAWAPTVSTAESPVVAVDLYTGLLPADFSDGVHLNQSGSMKVADRFYKALAPFFGKN